MKKLLKSLFVITLIASVLIGCSTESGDTNNKSSGGDGKTTGSIGFSISTLNNPFFVSMADGAEEMAKELGLELKIADAGNDTAKQSTDIEDLITSGVDVLIVNPEDSVAVGPAIQHAIDKGIKVIAVDRTVEGAAVDTYIGTDNVKAGEAVGEQILTILEEGTDIAILEGVPGASSAIDRHQGFINSLKGNVNIVATQTANYDRAEGMIVTENILQANPNIKAIVAANDEMALGAIEAIISSNKKPGEDIIVTGFDAGEDAINAVEEGTMLFTVEQQTIKMGKLAVETALKMINGEEYESEVPIDVTLLDIKALEN